jgi:transposase
MAKPLLPDELWEVIEPILPRYSPSPKGGRPRTADRKALTSILFVLKTGIACACRKADKAAHRKNPEGLAETVLVPEWSPNCGPTTWTWRKRCSDTARWRRR